MKMLESRKSDQWTYWIVLGQICLIMSVDGISDKLDNVMDRHDYGFGYVKLNNFGMKWQKKETK